MARSRPKAKSLATLAASLDTRKRTPPVERPATGVLRNSDVRALQARGAQPVEAERSRGRPASLDIARDERTAAPARAPAVPAQPREPVTRSVALSSLQRPKPLAPSKVPPGLPPESRRKYPRADLKVRAKLSLAGDPSHFFEATLPTLNISVGGLFLQSSFFLKPGTRLLIELLLPAGGNAKHPTLRAVKVMGVVARVVTAAPDDASGFAIRFTDYLDGSEVVLATHFLSPVLREFIAGYAKQHRFDASPEYIAHTADVLAAWELRKAELESDVWELASRPS